MAAKKNKGVPSGKIVYNGSIVRGIVELAVSEVEGVSRTNENVGKKGKDDINIVFDEGKNVDVDVTVAVRYGYNIPDVAYNIQQSVKYNVEAMSDYKIGKVDVHVIDVVFEENEHSEY